MVALIEETSSLRKHMKECASELTGPKKFKKRREREKRSGY